MPKRTPHQTLGLPPQATPDEIKHAYRALVLKWHPDRHDKDKATATKRFIEINEAYKQLTETHDLESNFEEPFMMPRDDDGQSQSSSLDRQSSRSSSEFSDDSYGFRRSRSYDSGFQTTPSSSFKESPTSSYFPKTSSQFAYVRAHRAPTPYLPERTSPTSSSPPRYETWRTGSDLPDGYRQSAAQGYSHVPRLSQPRPRASSIPKPPPPSIPVPAYPSGPGAYSHTTHRQPPNLPPPTSHQGAHPRLSHSVVLPAHSHSGSRSIPSPQHSQGSARRYQNHFGEVVAPGVHASPYDIPLVSIGLGPSGEWTYALPLTLEELFTGIHLTMPISRRLLSGRSRTVTLELDIPSGCRSSSRLMCRRVGHELQHGVFQDIAFVIEDKPHDRMQRDCDDLVMEARVPLVDSLRDFGYGEVPIVGVDGQALAFRVELPRHAPDGVVVNGKSILKGAGMPSRRKGEVVGRGDLIVNWEVIPPPPKKSMGFMKRLWKK